MAVFNPEIVSEFGFRPDSPQVSNAFTSLFIHQNTIHLLGNMLFLAAVGATVEQLSGTFRFSLVYLVGGLVGVAAHWLISSKAATPTPLVGASGAIAACVGYYASRYLQLKVPVARRMGATVAWIIGLWLLLQVVGAFVTIGDQKAATSFWSHIGGFVAGLAMSFAFRAPDLGQLQTNQEALQRSGERSFGATLAEAERQLESRPNDIGALKELVQASAVLDEPVKEQAALLRLIEILPEQQQGPYLTRLCELGKADALPIHRRTTLAEKLKESDPEAAAALLESVVDDPQTLSQKADAMLALASLKLVSDPNRARRIFADLESNYPLHPATELARAKGWL